MPTLTSLTNSSNIQLPTTEVMHQELLQSGILEAESASQYQAQVSAAKQVESHLLASAGDDTASESVIEHYEGWFLKYVPKVVGVGLTLQSLKGIYTSIIFIFVEYPQLSIELTQHHVTAADINRFTAKAILVGISTVISMFFALKLTILNTSLAKRASIVIGIVLFLSNGALQDFFVQLESGETFSNYAVLFLESFLTWPTRLFHQFR